MVIAREILNNSATLTASQAIAVLNIAELLGSGKLQLSDLEDRIPELRRVPKGPHGDHTAPDLFVDVRVSFRQ